MAPTEAGGERPSAVTTGAGLLAVATGASAALSFGFHAVATRALTADAYSALAALLAVMVATAVPVGATQAAVTLAVARHGGAGVRPDPWRVVRRTVAAGVLVAAVGAAAAPLLGAALRLDGPAPAALAAVWLGVVTAEAGTKGVLVGLRRFRPVAWALLVGAGIRMGLLLFPLLAGEGRSSSATTAVAVTVAGELAAAAVLFGGLFVAVRGRPSGPVVQAHWPDAGRALVAHLALWLFAGLAVVLGRRGLDPATAGAFAASATVAGGCVFLPQAVAVTVFPTFAGSRGTAVLARALALAAASAVACASVLVGAAPWVFEVFFGGAYSADRTLLALLCAGSASLGCLSVVAQFLVAHRRPAVWLVWFGLAAAVVTAGAAQGAPIALAVAFATCAAATLVVTATAAWHHARATAAATDPYPDDVTVDLRERADDPAAPELSVVMPTYNGGALLRPCVERVVGVLGGAGVRAEVIVVVDGSDDGSTATLAGLPPHVRVLELPTNLGKGAAVRRGFAVADGRAVGFIDSDGDIEPEVLVDLHDAVRGGAWAAIASKRCPGAAVRATRMRRLASRGYQVLARWLFELDVTDTQCGCKVFDAAALRAVLPHTAERGFAFDVELLAVGRRLGLAGPVERPARLARAGRSTLRPLLVVRFLVETVRLWRRLPPPVSTRAAVPAAPIASDPYVSPVLS